MDFKKDSVENADANVRCSTSWKRQKADKEIPEILKDSSEPHKTLKSIIKSQRSHWIAKYPEVSPYIFILTNFNLDESHDISCSILGSTQIASP